jgi:hypothetical protein
VTATIVIVASPQQSLRLDAFEARYPATRFEAVAQDPFSTALLVEVEDLETHAFLTITPTGRTLEA